MLDQISTGSSARHGRRRFLITETSLSTLQPARAGPECTHQPPRTEAKQATTAVFHRFVTVSRLNSRLLWRSVPSSTAACRKESLCTARQGLRCSSYGTALVSATPATADVLADWNVCSRPIIAAGRATVQFTAGPSTGLDLAVVHLAMHDAIQAYDQRFEPYAGAINPGGGSAIAAAARAAHTVLVTKFPPRSSPRCWPPSMRATRPP